MGQKSWGVMIGGLRLSFLGFQPRMRRILGLTIAFLPVCVLRSRQGRRGVYQRNETKATERAGHSRPCAISSVSPRSEHARSGRVDATAPRHPLSLPPRPDLTPVGLLSSHPHPSPLFHPPPRLALPSTPYLPLHPVIDASHTHHLQTSANRDRGHGLPPALRKGTSARPSPLPFCLAYRHHNP